MCNSRPVYRIGNALSLVRNRQNSKDKERLFLSRDGAVKLGRELVQAEQEISDAIAEKFIADSGVEISEVTEDRKKDGRLSFGYGVIVDFQNMTFETTYFRHRLRLCVTVCQHGTKSKIWFRSQCVGYRINQNANWKAPTDFSLEQLERFFYESKEVGKVALDELREIYYLRLKEYFLDCKDDGNISLEVAKRFEFKTFDSDNYALPALISDLKIGESFTDSLKESLRKTPGKRDAALIAVNLAIRGDQTDIEKLDLLKHDDSIEIIDHVSARGDVGVFVKKGVLIDGASQENYVGATFDSEATKEKRRPIESPAYRVAAEMLATVTGSI